MSLTLALSINNKQQIDTKGRGSNTEVGLPQPILSLALAFLIHNKITEVIKSRGHHCGDIEFVRYLPNEVDPVPLVMDLRIVHDRFGSSSDPIFNGNLHYPNNIDRSLNESADDKIRKYRADYNTNPPNTVSFMTAMTSTSGRLHCEFVRLLFLQDHRETDRFFESSGVQLP